MRVRKIGDWKESGPDGNHDSGLYVEAVDLPFQARRRYAQVSYRYFGEGDIKRLNQRETVDLPILSPSDLKERVTQ